MPEIAIPQPRTELASLPTPIHRLERLGEDHDAELFVKRDDRTAGVAQGNKIRKLEYVLADALAADADAVVTGGGLQSNHCRATAVLARELGLAPHLVLSGDPEGTPDGNHLLSRLAAATVEYLDAGIFELEAAMERTADRLEADGVRPYVVPLGASNPLGTLGYVRAYREIAAAAGARGTAFDRIFAPAGSMGTYAGLLTGSLLAGDDTAIVGVKTVERGVEAMEERAAELVRGVAALLDRPAPDPAELDRRIRVLDGYLGDGYGVPTDRCLRAIELAARREGLVLDPTYSGKAFGAFLAESAPGERALFVHTGGSYGAFPKREALGRTLADRDG